MTIPGSSSPNQVLRQPLTRTFKVTQKAMGVFIKRLDPALVKTSKCIFNLIDECSLRSVKNRDYTRTNCPRRRSHTSTGYYGSAASPLLRKGQFKRLRSAHANVASHEATQGSAATYDLQGHLSHAVPSSTMRIGQSFQNVKGNPTSLLY